MTNDKLPNSKQFPLNCPDAQKKFSGKKVAIKVNTGLRTELFIGKFVVHQYKDDPAKYISVHVAGQVFRKDPPNNPGWAFHLSEGHYASILPATDEKGEIEFAVQEVFQSPPPNRKPFAHVSPA